MLRATEARTLTDAAVTAASNELADVLIPRVDELIRVRAANGRSDLVILGGTSNWEVVRVLYTLNDTIDGKAIKSRAFKKILEANGYKVEFASEYRIEITW